MFTNTNNSGVKICVCFRFLMQTDKFDFTNLLCAAFIGKEVPLFSWTTVIVIAMLTNSITEKLETPVCVYGDQ